MVENKTKKALDVLLVSGIILKNEVGKSHIYRINKNKFYRTVLQDILKSEEDYIETVLTYLNIRLVEYCSVVWLYGSYGRGYKHKRKIDEITEDSDVDIFCIPKLGKEIELDNIKGALQGEFFDEFSVSLSMLCVEQKNIDEFKKKIYIRKLKKTI